MSGIGLQPPTIDPFDPAANIRTEVATAATVKVMRVEKDLAQELIRMLDPRVGSNLDRRA